MRRPILYILVWLAAAISHLPAGAQSLEQFLPYAKEGDEIAQYNAALCYLHGWGTEPNATRARHYMRIAAEAGEPHAIEHLCQQIEPHALAMAAYLRNNTPTNSNDYYESYEEGCYYGGLYGAMRDGLGTYLWDEGVLFTGEWEYGERYGLGITHFGEVTHYGAYDNNPQGFGAAITATPSTYLDNCPGGVVYVGNFANGQFEGTGTIYNALGEVLYYGNFHHGNPTGPYPSGERYSSYLWVEQQLPNGDSYIGEEAFGRREGFGIYRWANGSLWFGPWHNNLRHGEGFFISPGGGMMVGWWEAGELQ